jgi:hypothetical protein
MAKSVETYACLAAQGDTTVDDIRYIHRFCVNPRKQLPLLWSSMPRLQSRNMCAQEE